MNPTLLKCKFLLYLDTLDKENTAVTAGSPAAAGVGYMNPSNFEEKPLNEPKKQKDDGYWNILYSKRKFMKADGFVGNIEVLTNTNDNFRRVLYTGKYSQLVLMRLSPGEDIGMEVHEKVDQFFRVDSGVGIVIIDGKKHRIEDGSGIIVPAGSEHNVINISKDKDLKLYTIYSPPEHKDGVVRHTKQEAEAKKEHFDGNTTEKF
jgi:mannose-6-phosphate isomerase-like protein (cupin superfamily)